MSDTNEARMDPKEREQRLNDVREIVVIQLKRKQPTCPVKSINGTERTAS